MVENITTENKIDQAANMQQELKEKIYMAEQLEDERNYQTIQLVVFRLGHEEYALRIEEIKEVVLTPAITRIPQTDPHIRGVANIRGNILAIIDLEKRLGLREDGDDSIGKFTLVIDDKEYKVGILVGSVPNTIEIREDLLDDSVNVIQDSTVDERSIHSIAKLGDRLIILLNIKDVLSKDDLRGVIKKSIEN